MGGRGRLVGTMDLVWRKPARGRRGLSILGEFDVDDAVGEERGGGDVDTFDSVFVADGEMGRGVDGVDGDVEHLLGDGLVGADAEGVEGAFGEEGVG